MKVLCKKCNRYHNFNATEMRNIVTAFVFGDAQNVTTTGVDTACLDIAAELGASVWEEVVTDGGSQ